MLPLIRVSANPVPAEAEECGGDGGDYHNILDICSSL